MTVRNVCAPAQRQLGWWTLALGAALVATPKPKLDAATFTFNNPNCSSFVVSGSPPTQTVACATGGAVPVCTLATPQTTVAVGTQVTIAANCTNSPTSYLWTGGGCGGNGATTSCTVTKSRSSTITFTVAGINGAGTGSTGQISVTWQ